MTNEDMTIYDICNECLYRMTHNFYDNNIGEFYKYMSILKQVINENLIISPKSFSPNVVTMPDNNSVIHKKVSEIFTDDFVIDKRFLPNNTEIDTLVKDMFIKQLKNDISVKGEKYWEEKDD